MTNSVILSKDDREIHIDTLLHPGDLIKKELPLFYQKRT